MHGRCNCGRSLSDPFYVKQRRREEGKNLVMISWNNHIAKSDPATPRTADDTMCVIGDVTLIDNKLARLIMKPSRP
jgi:hypothetical protein